MEMQLENLLYVVLQCLKISLFDKSIVYLEYFTDNASLVMSAME